MDIPIDQILTPGASGLSLVGSVWLYFSLNRAKEANIELKQQMEKMWEWKDHHEIIVADKRSDYETKIAVLNGKIEVLNNNQQNQYNSIIDRLDKNEKMLEKLGEKMDRRELK